jgi:hypothetical protein
VARKAMVTVRVDFTKEDCAALKGAGLTDHQLFWLRRSLPAMADFAGTPASFGDVGDRLGEIKDHFAEAQRHLQAALSEIQRGHASPLTHSPWRVAFGHIAIACARESFVDLADDPEETVPARIDPLVLTRILVAACEKASNSFPPKAQSLRRSKAPIIRLIEQALNRPPDHESAKVAHAMRVSRSRNAPFLRVAEIVFDTLNLGTPDHAIKTLLSDRKRGGA